MATILLQAAGAFLGGALGPVGSAIGSAAGAMAGYMIDRALIEGTRRVEGTRLGSVRPFMAEEGAPIARVYGTARLGGNLIWATRFEESESTERQGSKGGGTKVTTYTYFGNFAFALCEGEIAGVRRIWADGRELDLDLVTVRIHRGSQWQAADPLIEAKQGGGNAPAYRGLAYAVFERFPLSEYGNRIPQFQFEVMRPVSPLNAQVRSVVLLPGSTEYGLLPRPVTRTPSPGVTLQVNRNVLHGPSDLVASLDELQMLCPNLQEVAVVVTWFGDDLRAGVCRTRPKVMYSDLTDHSEPWSVCGVERAAAATVSFIDGAAAYGGTPTDQSVRECIAEIRGRGLRVTLMPFMMMDVAPGNGLPDPYGGASQPPFPWRGRITCHPAPGRSGTPDKTAAARAEVEAFCGGAGIGHFSISDGAVAYSGAADDWGYGRLVLHYAHLAKAAGGVDAFLIGSELRGLTTLRDGANAFPFVEALCALAGEVRTVLGSGPAITYGADWTEYFGYQPPDGSGDAIYHLDPLWAHPAISAVGIDNYMPLSDWRDADYAGGNPDGFSEPYDKGGLRGQVARGEGYDWYYPDVAARAGRDRAPITDGAYGKPWVFRYKDIKSWWEFPHVDRIGGVEAGLPTAWMPMSKPVWFTELGCPAVDKGPNQPNVFPDPKSSENAIPYFSSGGRSDVAPARFLLAHMEHWDPASPYHQHLANPISPFYGGRMVDIARMALWAWDARPFPAYPLRGDLWRDGDNWHCGHWLNGRLSAVTTGDLIAAIMADHGIHGVDASRVGGSMEGYLIDAPSTARAALEPLVSLYGIAVRDEDAGLVFSDEAVSGGAPVEIAEMVVPDAAPTVERSRAPDAELPDEAELGFVDLFQDYQSGVARAALPGAQGGRPQQLGLPGCLDTGNAAALLADWMQRKWTARDGITFSVPPGAVDVVPGALVAIAGEQDPNEYLVTDIELGLARKVTARRIARGAPTPWRAGGAARSGPSTAVAGMPHVLMLDLPWMPGGNTAQDQFKLAAYASPWTGQAIYSSPESTGYAYNGSVNSPATAGELVQPLRAGPEGRIDFANAVVVRLYHGALSSVSYAQLMNGANTAAIRSVGGAWEIVQFGQAQEIEPSVWLLTSLLRGQYGTGDATAAGAAPGAAFVLLDHAVVRAGLSQGQTGLMLNWRVGPSGRNLGDGSFALVSETGGVRSQQPLAPVHLRLERKANGDALISWIRRGRVDADNWMAEDIPLGEESELYRVEIRSSGGAAIRTVEVTLQNWTYTLSQIATDFPLRPAGVVVTVRQISASVGAGLPASKTFVVA